MSESKYEPAAPAGQPTTQYMRTPPHCLLPFRSLWALLARPSYQLVFDQRHGREAKEDSEK